jgi:hypothetical protein
MTKPHSPGPWQIGTTKGHAYVLAASLGEEPGELGFVADMNKHLDPDQQFANARLIACAPDLFEALQEIVDGDDGLDPRLDKARAVVALAKGKGIRA